MEAPGASADVAAALQGALRHVDRGAHLRRRTAQTLARRSVQRLRTGRGAIAVLLTLLGGRLSTMTGVPTGGASRPACWVDPLEDWPGERYLDVRAQDALLPIMRDRMAACRAKGFRAVDADNVDSYESDGHGLSAHARRRPALRARLAKEAHRQGLAYGLKNAPGLVRDLKGTVDFAVVEECFEQGGCGAFQPLIAAGRRCSRSSTRGRRAASAPRRVKRALSAILRDLRARPSAVRCLVNAARSGASGPQATSGQRSAGHVS